MNLNISQIVFRPINLSVICFSFSTNFIMLKKINIRLVILKEKVLIKIFHHKRSLSLITKPLIIFSHTYPAHHLHFSVFPNRYPLCFPQQPCSVSTMLPPMHPLIAQHNSYLHLKPHHRIAQPEIQDYFRMYFTKNAYIFAIFYYTRSPTL